MQNVICLMIKTRTMNLIRFFNNNPKKFVKYFFEVVKKFEDKDASCKNCNDFLMSMQKYEKVSKFFLKLRFFNFF